ncbi:alpha/beta hydrolase [Flammeovirga sp. MY04]|uniref:alpha/beta fold hydrolase n=1 Tax=Flammeovirga sp. MY04 TaxID=1191459 RepID=UPI0008060E92|nr:alpha/beta hydrolase [Flammeovirga sp. MY04]ANQ51581.1 alpha/beta hydrolase [Flammeovirga sp. MY04]
MNNQKLSSINLYDKFNAAFVSLITPEMPGLNKIRKQNNYSDQPTLAQPFEMPLEYLSINGVKIRMAKSEIDKDKDKESIILLSAFPHTIIAYSPIWDDLKKDYNLYAYDLPGFGGSANGEEYMSFDYQGQFLDTFIQHFKIENLHIVGPDVGMPTTLNYIINHQHKVKSIMIGDGPAALPTSEPSVMRKMVHSEFWRIMFVIAGSGALIESAKNLGNVQYVPNKYEISDYKKAHTGKVANNMKWFKKYTASVPHLDENLKNIELPVKVFWGEHEAILHPVNAENLHKRLPNSELEIFDNCGHFVYQDDYPRFIKLIRDWVERHK